MAFFAIRLWLIYADPTFVLDQSRQSPDTLGHPAGDGQDEISQTRYVVQARPDRPGQPEDAARKGQRNRAIRLPRLDAVLLPAYPRGNPQRSAQLERCSYHDDWPRAVRDPIGARHKADAIAAWMPRMFAPLLSTFWIGSARPEIQILSSESISKVPAFSIE